MSYLKRILTAPVYDVAQSTPVHEVTALSRRFGNRILLKREDLQPVFSFKLRGAYNKIAQLDPQARAHGVIAASAGNHAQGVALAAARLGIPATIVMPLTTPEIKHQAVAERGARVMLHGPTFDDACAHALELARQQGLTFIHPYDDPDVIAGQGTIGLELLRQEPDLDAVFVPVGGGGLLAGIAACLGELRPEVRVIGVEFSESACLAAAMRAGRRVTLPQVGLFADGVAVARIGAEPFRVIRRHVNLVITVEADEICAAIKDIFGATRTMAEPAGALALAGLKRYQREYGARGENHLAVLSGANVNFHGLRYVSERAELGEGREAIFAVIIPERAGSFHQFCTALGKRVVTEFNYRYADPDQAHVFVGVRIRDAEERFSLADSLRLRDYAVTDLTDNEIAKLHLRYMVGGHAPELDDERLIRFQFPERPGALEHFLARLAGRWSISIFHYRNHDASHGRVLAGFRVPEHEAATFARFLETLGYHYIEETDNPAFQIFLGQGAGRAAAVHA